VERGANGVTAADAATGGGRAGPAQGAAGIGADRGRVAVGVLSDADRDLHGAAYRGHEPGPGVPGAAGQQPRRPRGAPTAHHPAADADRAGLEFEKPGQSVSAGRGCCGRRTTTGPDRPHLPGRGRGDGPGSAPSARADTHPERDYNPGPDRGRGGGAFPAVRRQVPERRRLGRATPPTLGRVELGAHLTAPARSLLWSERHPVQADRTLRVAVAGERGRLRRRGARHGRLGRGRLHCLARIDAVTASALDGRGQRPWRHRDRCNESPHGDEVGGFVAEHL